LVIGHSLLPALLKFIAASRAEVVLINLEDLWAEIKPQNVPATSTQRPNWRRKAAHTLEGITSLANIHDLLQNVNNCRRS